MAGFNPMLTMLNTFLTPAASPVLAEGKGLPAGWVSQWGNKRAQKQTDGSWVYVPDTTPLGAQPLFKSAPGASGPAQAKFTPTNDDELVSYLQSVNFNVPETQKTLMGSPKFVNDMLKKFGAGFFEKYQKAQGSVPVPPSPAPPAAAATTPVQAALSALGFAPESKQAFALDQLFKTGSQDAAVNAYSAKYKLKYATAFHEVEALVKQAAAKGVVSTSGDWDELKVTFNLGTGPVISAPALAVSASVSSGGVETEEPPAPKKTKKKAAAPASGPAETPVTKPEPSVENPFHNKKKYDAAVAKLDYPVGSVGAFLSNALYSYGGNEESAAKSLSHFYNVEPTEAAALASAAKKVALSAFSGAMAKTAFQQISFLHMETLHLSVTSPELKTQAPPAAALADLDASAVAYALKNNQDMSVVLAITAKKPAVTGAVASAFVATLKDIVKAVPATEVGYALQKTINQWLAAPVPKPPPTDDEVFGGGVKAVARTMKQLGYKPGTSGAMAVGLLMANEGSVSKSTAAFVNVNPSVAPDFAEKLINAVKKEMLALASGAGSAGVGPTDPAVSQALDAPPPPSPTSTAAAVGGPNVPTSKDSSKKGVSLPTIPPMVALSYAGDAKVKLGGNKPKKFLKDAGGTLFLHKYGADKIRAMGGEVASNIAAIVGGPGSYVPVKSVETTGDWGTIQPIVPDVEGDLSKTPISKLSADQIRQLQRERVIDWVISNHDSKSGNFIVTKDGNVLGIDKEQAFKFIGKDSLSLDYSPNPSTPIYNALYQAYADKEIDLDPNDTLPFVQAVENTPEADWKKAVQPYLNALPAESRDAVWDAMLQRKNGVRKDFEKFFTQLKKLRGEGPFTFAGISPAPAKPTKVVGLGVLVPPKVPDMAELSYDKPAVIGGAGEKHFFTAADGKLWLLKVAAGKSTKKPEPWKVASQSLFATIGAAVKPSTPPVGAATYKGLPATVQPWLGDGLKTLSSVDPAKLTPSQQKDVADEHVLDWLMSQHDTHGGNLVVLPSSGAVVGIDKEQGFKYLLPNPKWTNSTPEGDKLSTDYHPNAQYGESEPYYNTFWKKFADGSMNFDPVQLSGAIKAIEAIPDDEYVKALEAYGQAAYPADASKAVQFYEKALARKKNIRKDFEAFISDLYEKRTKKKGKFTFDGGWVPQGSGGSVSTPATPNAVASQLGLVGKKSGVQYPPLPASLTDIAAKLDDVVKHLGLDAEEAKVLALWQSHGGDSLPASVGAQQDLISLGWSAPDAKAIVGDISLAAAQIPGFNYHAFMSNPGPKPKLTPDTVTGTPTPNTSPSATLPAEPTATPALPPPPKTLGPATLGAAGAALGIASNSVYWSALEALSKHGSESAAIAALNAASVGVQGADALNSKRVKYVHKKLKSLGVSYAPPPAPAASGAAPVAATQASVAPSALLYSPNKPTVKGSLGVLNPAVVTPTGAAAPAPEAPAAPPTPAGFPEPPKGQMWEVSTAAAFAQKHVYKVKPPKDASGNPDTSSPNAVLKLTGLSLDGAKEYLQKLGVEPIETLGKPLFKEKDGKVLVLVNKNAWDQAKSAKASATFSQLVPIPPPPPPPDANDKFKTTVKAGELKNPEAVPNLEELKTLHESKNIGFGAAFNIGGAAVEQHSVSAQRRKTEDGKEYYRFNFKIRAPFWKKFKGGEDSTFRYRRSTYKEDTDLWQDGPVGENSTDSIPNGRKWESEGSSLWLGAQGSKYAYRGAVFADVFPKAGETPFEALARTLEAVEPGLSQEVLKNPTKEDRDVLGLSALLWSVAPQQADTLPETERTVPALKARLTKLGYTEEDFANLSFERTAIDRISPVLKGRHLKLKAKHKLQDITVGVSTPERVAQQLKSGTIGIVQRLQHGIPCSDGDNASPSSDQETGGADYVYGGITKKGAGDGWSKWTYGSIQMVYDLSELDRLDTYQHSSDQYGVCDPAQKSGAFKNRTTLEDNAGNCFEVCFKRGLPARKLLKVLCRYDHERLSVLAACKKAGITEVNGTPIEDLVIVKGETNPNGFYKVHLEPAGY